MTAMELLCHIIDIYPGKLSKIEQLLLEAELFTRLCKELKEIFREQYKDYFRLMKFTKEKENAVLESEFVRFLVKDILATENYTATGIAQYANTHEDIILDIITGKNMNPSGIVQRRIIELHKEVKRDLYEAIVKKIS